MDAKMVSPPNLHGLFDRFKLMQTQRESSDSLIKDLFIYCDYIETRLRQENQRLSDCELDLSDATKSRRELQHRIKTSEEKQDRLSKENEALKTRNPYVLALIDGDGLIFQEQWIKQGVEGGKKAAYALRSAIAELENLDDDVEIVAKVVANLSGLGKAMQRGGCLDTQSDLKDFTLGFTQAKASFDFIDVGYGKERADSKIKEAVRWNLRNYNCKRVLLGISHDAGYAPFLDELLQDETVRQKVSIIEGVPTVGELAATQVKIKSLGSALFRSEKLLAKSPISAAVQPTTYTQPTQLMSPPLSESYSLPRASPSTSYAGVMSSASPPPKISLPFATKPRPSTTARQPPSVYQLIPPELPDWNPGLRGFDDQISVNVTILEVVKKRKDSDKLCNNHYLRGPCTKGRLCPFEHHHRPTDDEYNAIAVLARQNPCARLQDCNLADCIYGHHCPSIKDGTCAHPFCRFSVDSHPPGTKFKNAFIRSN